MDTKIIEFDTEVKYYRIYHIFHDNQKIDTVVTRRPSVVKQWIRKTESINSCRLDRLIVGLDVEWRANFKNRKQNRVATLQLCVGDRCLIFQILYFPYRIAVLRRFLRNPNYTFVGVGIESDAKKLKADYGLKVSNTRDIRAWAAKEMDASRLSEVGLRDLVEVVLGKKLEKPKDVTLSDWESSELTEPQVIYACLDAYVSFQIGRQLSSWY